ncbi:F-box protein [Monoraphidium neglectum]|uniref:F-box protein n=1 Tax=Monoraphidium neglectum TaxID=145388 RepID=A0A0D2NHV4_9CHLO|nr:F-box protein [Monoraphidium neglectum]KIZ04556.1 F-box protein [Monoraphidium neglectum]|eukprot:XP_013903575.1 F-box protein [Monoraphidium neglectum]
MVSHERLIHTCSAIAVPHTTAPAAPAADALPGPARRGGSGGGGADSRDVHQAGNLVDGGAGAAELAEGGVLGVVLLQLGIGPVRAQQLWERALNTWSKGPKAALVWRHILPVGADAAAAAEQLLRDGDGPRFATEHEEAQHYSLLGCFQELPSLTASLLGDGPPPAAGPPDVEGDGGADGGPGGAAPRGGSSIADLPDEALSAVLSRLPPRDLARAAAACRLLRRLDCGAVPGLKLTLYPHQRRALRWMAAREAPGAGAPHPFVRRLVTSSGLRLFVNQVTGELSVDSPPQMSDVRGGFFCDEP